MRGGWGKRERWAAGAIAVLAAVAGGWYARTSTQVPTPAPLTADEIARAGPIEPWWEPTPDQIAYAEETGQPLAIRNTLGQRFVPIPPGTFPMGPDPLSSEREQQVQEVVLRRGLYLGATEVTDAEFRRFRPRHPKIASGAPDLPVVRVDLYDVAMYCAWLTMLERAAGILGADELYAVPTEAEWERACRAGGTARFSFGDSEQALQQHADDHMWYAVWRYTSPPELETRPGHSLGRWHPVAQKLANPWGLYDMHGNVAEWTRSSALRYPYAADGGRDVPLSFFSTREEREQYVWPTDEWPIPHGVVRGGSWDTTPPLCGCNDRFYQKPREPAGGDYRAPGAASAGFRLALYRRTTGSQ